MAVFGLRCFCFVSIGWLFASIVVVLVFVFLCLVVFIVTNTLVF